MMKLLNLNFIGNVEGRDIYGGEVDVIVCDGFIGNVALKVSEGLVDMFKKLLRESLEATITGKIGYALSKNAFGEFRKRLDYSEYGGAPLLGVKGNILKAHGSSNRHAWTSAIRAADQIIHEDLYHRIESDVARANALAASVPAAEPVTH